MQPVIDFLRTSAISVSLLLKFIVNKVLFCHDGNTRDCLRACETLLWLGVWCSSVCILFLNPGNKNLD